MGKETIYTFTPSVNITTCDVMTEMLQYCNKTVIYEKSYIVTVKFKDHENKEKNSSYCKEMLKCHWNNLGKVVNPKNKCKI